MNLQKSNVEGQMVFTQEDDGTITASHFADELIISPYFFSPQFNFIIRDRWDFTINAVNGSARYEIVEWDDAAGRFKARRVE